MFDSVGSDSVNILAGAIAAARNELVRYFNECLSRYVRDQRVLIVNELLQRCAQPLVLSVLCKEVARKWGDSTSGVIVWSIFNKAHGTEDVSIECLESCILLNNDDASDFVKRNILDADEHRAMASLKAAYYLGDTGIELIRSASKSALSKRVQVFAALQLAAMGDPSGKMILLDEWNQNDESKRVLLPSFRLRLLCCLAEIGVPDALSDIKARLANETDDTQVEFKYALAGIRSFDRIQLREGADRIAKWALDRQTASE